VAASALDDLLASQGVVVLDGGLATELEERGHDLGDRLWSARLLFEAPEAIRDVHAAYLLAGADCVTTASYQATLPGLEAHGLSSTQAEEVLRLSVDLARQARDAFVARGAAMHRHRPLVAASIGPYGACLANGAEYTGDYDLDEEGLMAFHRPRWALLANAGADLMACETLPSAAEARVLARLLAETPQMHAWFSFTCRDDGHISDGTPMEDVARSLDGQPGVAAIGVNCVPPEAVSGLLAAARRGTSLPLVAYPNSGQGWDAARRRWTGSSDAMLARRAPAWRAAGARLLGGCCCTRPADIRQLRMTLLST